MLGLIIRALRTLKRSPAIAVTSVGALLVYCWNRFNDYQSGSALMTSWLGANWPTVVFNAIAGSIWFSLFCLLVIIGCLVWVGIKTEHSERILTENNAIIQARETAARQEALSYPLQEARLHSFSRELREFAEFINREKQSIELQKNVLEREWSYGWKKPSMAKPPNVRIEWHEGLREFNYRHLKVNLQDFGFKVMIPHISQRELNNNQIHRRENEYDPSTPNNVLFLEIMAENYATALSRIACLEHALRVETDRLSRAETEIARI